MYKIRPDFILFFILFILYASLMCYYESIYDSIRRSNLLNYINLNERTTIDTEPFQDCPEIPPNLLGRRSVVSNPIPKIDVLEYELLWLEYGGHYSPPCRTEQTTAILIPFRNRDDQLLLFLKNMHPLLKRQQINYTVFVIEQIDDLPFNRGGLFNAGFKEVMKIHNFSCVFLHDVDLFPEDDRNLYKCSDQPKHMITGMNKWGYKLEYGRYFGGVVAIKSETYREVNGFSNRFWGWGAEDDDFEQRLTNRSISWIRPQQELGLYFMVKHNQETPNPDRFEILKDNVKYFSTDGLVSTNYRLIGIERHFLYTKIGIELFKNV